MFQNHNLASYFHVPQYGLPTSAITALIRPISGWLFIVQFNRYMAKKQIHFFKCIKAMVDWTNFTRDVCAEDTRRQQAQLGGSDNGWQQIVVEMEESYFYSRT